MITLDFARQPQKVQNIPKPIDYRTLRRIDFRKRGTRIFTWGIVDLARKKKNIRVIFNLSHAMVRSCTMDQILSLCMFIRRNSKICRKLFDEDRVNKIYHWLFR